MLEVVACYYSYLDSQILIGGVDDEENLVISQGIHRRQIEPAEFAKEVVALSNFERPIWINSRDSLKKALSIIGVSGEIDLSQEDIDVKERFLSLKHKQKVKMPPDFEARGNQFALALRILVKALMPRLSGEGYAYSLEDGCCLSYDLENGEIDPRAELRDVLKLFDV